MMTLQDRILAALRNNQCCEVAVVLPFSAFFTPPPVIQFPGYFQWDAEQAFWQRVENSHRVDSTLRDGQLLDFHYAGLEMQHCEEPLEVVPIESDLPQKWPVWQAWIERHINGVVVVDDFRESAPVQGLSDHFTLTQIKGSPNLRTLVDWKEKHFVLIYSKSQSDERDVAVAESLAAAIQRVGQNGLVVTLLESEEAIDVVAAAIQWQYR